MSAADLRRIALTAMLMAGASARGGGPGTTSGQGLLLPAAARPEGMGGAFVGVAEGPAALFWNPAGLADLEDLQVSVMHADYLARINYQVLSIARPTGVVSGFAAAASLLDYGASPRTAAGPDGLPGEASGMLSASDFILTAGWGSALPRLLGIECLRVGASVKTTYQRHADLATSGLGLSGGLLWAPPVPRLKVGFLADNLGGVFGQAMLPINWRLGASWALPVARNWRLLWAADGRFALDTRFQGGAGTELSAFDLAAIRLGWRGGGLAQSGPTFGMGFSVPPRWTRGRATLRLEYAGEVAGDFGLTHRIELSAAFGDGVSRAARAAHAKRSDMVARASLQLYPEHTCGRAGEKVRVKGTGFPARSRLAVMVNGVSTSPLEVTVDAGGILAATMISIEQPMPAGAYSVVLDTSDGARPFVFAKAYEVRPLVVIDPTDDGGDHTLAGASFTLHGTGLEINSYIAANSVRIGTVGTRHPPIRVGRDGVLRPTTIVAEAALPAGQLDLTVPAGQVTAIASTYEVSTDAAAEMDRRQEEVKSHEAAEAVAAVRALESARSGLEELVRSGGERLVPREVASLTREITTAEAELQASQYERTEDRSRRILDRLTEVGKQVQGARRGEFVAYAKVLSAGFEAIQFPGAGPSSRATASVTMGRKVLADAKGAIAAGQFDKARALLKASAELLRKAHAESGTPTAARKKVKGT